MNCCRQAITMPIAKKCFCGSYGHLRTDEGLVSAQPLEGHRSTDEVAHLVHHNPDLTNHRSGLLLDLGSRECLSASNGLVHYTTAGNRYNTSPRSITQSLLGASLVTGSQYLPHVHSSSSLRPRSATFVSRARRPWKCCQCFQDLSVFAPLRIGCTARCAVVVSCCRHREACSQCCRRKNAPHPPELNRNLVAESCRCCSRTR